MANKPSGAAPTAPAPKSRPPEKGLFEKLLPSVYALWRVIKKPGSEPAKPAGTAQFPGQPPEPPMQQSAEPVAETPVAPETAELVQPAAPQLQPMGQSEPAQPQQPPQQPVFRTPPVEDQPRSAKPEVRPASEPESLLAEPEFDAAVDEPYEEPDDQDINLGWSEIEDSTNKAREDLLALQKTRAESAQVRAQAREVLDRVEDTQDQVEQVMGRARNTFSKALGPEPGSPKVLGIYRQDS